jgi:glucokinase
VFEFAQAGHPAGGPAVRQLLADLTVGLNAMIYLYGPDVLVLGGGMANSLGPWLEELQQGLFATPFAGYQASLRISTLGEQAGLLGAASL